MPVIVGIAGSLRKGSYNHALLEACIAAAPTGTDIVAGTIEGIPLYDGDLEESHGLPDAVVTLKTLVQEADGLLICSPEYNNSMPGVLKNALDWMSRGGDMKAVFGGKPVAIAGASPGGFGTVLAQTAWLPVLKALGTTPWSGGRLVVSRAHTLFDAEGRLTDERTAGEVTAFVSGFADFISAGASK